MGLYGGLGYGIMQDLVVFAQGRRVSYMDWVSRIAGYPRSNSWKFEDQR